MKTILLLTLFVSSQVYSQSNSLEDLIQQRKDLQKKVIMFQDSIQVLDDEISKFPIKDLSEPLQAYIIDGSVLREKPSMDSEEVEVFNEKTAIQVIDIYKEFYLVCLSGTCGYIHKKNVRRKQSSF